MATMHKIKAIKNINKGKSSVYYSYVEADNRPNPVITQFERDLNDYMLYVKKRNAGDLKLSEHPRCKITDNLFDIWTRYVTRIPLKLYLKNLMKMGDFLAENKEYFTALWQCYDRYLNHLGTRLKFESIKNTQDLKDSFFRQDSNFNADEIHRSILGYLNCNFRMIVLQDPKLQNDGSIKRLAEILRLLRLLMTLQLETEPFAWLVYNSTIYIYTVGRHMMQVGLSKLVLEYLLFAALAMETSIPLLELKYLPWRSTLYSAVCQCYFDLKLIEEGENFARRCLTQINELYELELASENGEKGARSREFREAVIKMGVYLFKRMVFETRRRNVKRKLKVNYKEINGLAWPRTMTERLLNEMFDCPAAQFLAIEEALFDSNRRLGVPIEAEAENEKEQQEVQDVIMELLLAAEYIACGGIGKKIPSEYKNINVSKTSQIIMATNGETGVHLKNMLRICKMAFSYECWEIFRRMSFRLSTIYDKLTQTKIEIAVIFNPDNQIIQLLSVIDRYFMYLRKVKQQKENASKLTFMTNHKSRQKQNQLTQRSDQQKSKATKESISDFMTESVYSESDPTAKDEDLLVFIAHKLLMIMDSSTCADANDHDVIIDSILILWGKCKDVFGKVQTGSEETFRWVTKMDNFPKWLFILNVTHECMCHFGFTTIDLLVFIHCSLRLGLVYESVASAISSLNESRRRETNDSESVVTFFSDAYARQTKITLFDCSESQIERYSASVDVKENLFKAKNVLKKSLTAVSVARALMSKPDRSSLCIIDYDDLDSPNTADKLEIFNNHNQQAFEYKGETKNISSDIIDYNTELLYTYQRLSLKLAIGPELEPVDIEKEFEKVLKDCRKNKISQSLLYLCKALYLIQADPDRKSSDLVRKTIEKAFEKVIDAQNEDQLLNDKHVKINLDEMVKGKVPPAPLVLLKSATSVTVCPRKFESTAGIKPSWYRVFASKMTNINFRARITDYSYSGSGEQIPADNFQSVRVEGLCPDEKYIFAVGAYDEEGELINLIGESTDPILTSNTYSILYCWALLCQFCFQIRENQLALTAFDKLRKHFFIEPAETMAETIVLKNEPDFKIQFHQLNYNVIEKSSFLMLRKFIDCLFIVSQINIKEKSLYCNNLFETPARLDSQIERLKECENLLVAIELAAWLNDYNVILQSVVTIYGYLAPLVYFRLAFEPITKILSHCMLVFEEIPASFLARKSKSVNDNLHHMLACITFYVTDTLNRSGKKTLSEVFNTIGRKLLGDEVQENSSLIEQSEKQQQQQKTQQQAEDATSKKSEKSLRTLKTLELRAYETYTIRENPCITKQTTFMTFTGNEDFALINAHIQQNSAKLIYKDIVLFRKRSNFFEILLSFLQKALEEELVKDINEWCFDIFEWLQLRNNTIVGPKQVMAKSNAGLKALFNFEQPEDTENTENDENKVALIPKGQTEKAKPTYVSKVRPRPRIKKYRFIIPVELDQAIKNEMEIKQKAAIDSIYYCFPIKYDNWRRRIKLRKTLIEEASYKSGFFAIWALSNFSILVNRIHQSSPQNRMNYQQRLGNSAYLDPQQFLFDKNGALILDKNDEPIATPVKTGGMVSSTSVLVNIKHFTNGVKKAATKGKQADDKIHELRDTSELISEALTKVIEPLSEQSVSSSLGSLQDVTTTVKKVINPISLEEFNEIAKRVFSLFRNSVVIAHRYKKWTDLQNNCKLILNCINSLMISLPAITNNNQKVFGINDLWEVVVPSVYIAAENLLEMLYVNEPIDQPSNAKELKSSFNKWYTSDGAFKGGSSLKFKYNLDDCTSIDLRFVKDFVFRALQCLASLNKFEKLLSVAMKFNVLTSYKYAEALSPLIVNSQSQLTKQLAERGALQQAHFEKLKNNLGRYPNMEDLIKNNFNFVSSENKNLFKMNNLTEGNPLRQNLNIELDERAKELITVPVDMEETVKHLTETLCTVKFIDRSVFHSRQLLSIYLLTQTSHYEFFGVKVDLPTFYKDMTGGNSGAIVSEAEDLEGITDSQEEHPPDSVSRINQTLNCFHTNPIDITSRNFKNNMELYVSHIKLDLGTVIESYQKTIKLLLGFKEKDLAIQLMHELGNIYHFSKDIAMAYRNWNEALDTLVGVKNSLLHWRKEFTCENDKTNQINTKLLLDKCGIWGCLLGGVLASKMAQYYLVNDLELQIECCLFSAALFKAIFSASLSHSKYDIGYARDNADHMTTDFLIPGFLFNSDIHRFDIRYIISALNFICLELISSEHFYNVLPAVSLYEYLARRNARDLLHTVFARIIKLECLIRLNLFNEAVLLMYRINNGEQLPHYIDENYKRVTDDKFRYNEYVWDPSKPVYDLDNLRCLEGMLSLRLPKSLAKLYAPQLTCRLYIVQCKFYLQVASCLPCLPDLKRFYGHKLYNFINKNSLTEEAQIIKPIVASNNKEKEKINLDDNPDIVKVFTKLTEPLTLEFIKGCLIGTAKTIVLKCIGLFSKDFPEVDKYVVSINWQREFKYECNLLLANIADQCQLGYLALQSIVDAMKELNYEESNEVTPITTNTAPKKKNMNKKKRLEKRSKLTKKGVHQMFDTTSKSHLNARRWMRLRLLFIQYMFNQLDTSDMPKEDENILCDFGDLSYYCDKCLNESDKFYDSETKAYVHFVLISSDLIHGFLTLQECQGRLKTCLGYFQSCNQLSISGFQNYLKTQLLMSDISYSLNLTSLTEANREAFGIDKIITRTIQELACIEESILFSLKVFGNEVIEYYTNKDNAFFNTILDGVKNLFNPLLFYLCHTKLRLGTCLILRSSMQENSGLKTKAAETCQNAFNVLTIGVELNKVMSERSVLLEIEFSYKQAYCYKDFFMKYKQCSLADVLNAYNHVIKLSRNSVHDLSIIKDCYLELAIVFISIKEPSIAYVNAPREFTNIQTGFNWGKLSMIDDNKKKEDVKAEQSIKAALVAINYLSRCSQAIKAKNLLPGHQLVRENAANVADKPLFVVNDLFGYRVLAERKKVYRDAIEKEVLTLAPGLEPAKKYVSFDEKVALLTRESDESITWINMLNYQTKLQHLNSMKNMNLLKHGKNRHKFAELYTIGFTPILKNLHYVSARLCMLNMKMKASLDIYEAECQAPQLNLSYFMGIVNNVSSGVENHKFTSNSGMFSTNLGTNLSNRQIYDNEKIFDWPYLQDYPANYNYTVADSVTADTKNSSEDNLPIDNLLNLSWYKCLIVDEADLVKNTSKLTGVITYKSLTNEDKLKFKILSGDMVEEIHGKIAPIKAIADTRLNVTYTNDKLDIDFEKATIEIISSIATLFGKSYKHEKDKWPFDLIPSNFNDLEGMFNTKFGGHTNNQSLKDHIISLFF